MSIRLAIAFNLLILLSFNSVLYAQTKPGDSVQTQHQPAWLGVTIRPLSTELKAHLTPYLEAGEGLIVDSVEPGSPAEKAGIKKYDVIVSFNQQKLYSTEQLSSLVYYTDADTEVILKVIHQAQPMSIKVKLATRKTPPFAQTRPRLRNRHPTQPDLPFPAPPPFWQQDNMSSWDAFESVEVKTLENGRYRATVSYKDESDETKTFTFEGSKQDIIEQIKKHKDLPADKKRALLGALSANPTWFSRPDTWKDFNDFLNEPMLQRNPFNHPFFREPGFTAPFDKRYPYSPQLVPPWQLHLYPQGPHWNDR